MKEQNGALVALLRAIQNEIDILPSGWSPAQAPDRRADDLSARDEAARDTDRSLVQEDPRHRRQLTVHWQRLLGTAWEEG
jgi:MoxR-like ATPase